MPQMPERVRITDVSPRDGLQNEAGVISTADKVRLVELLIEAEVDEIEVSSFVSPKWVPQLGDAAEVFGALSPMLARRSHAPCGSPPFGRGQGEGSGSPPARPRNSREMTVFARGLRREMTAAEVLLWSRLQRRQVGGLKFRRQQPFGPFVLDFYCASCRVAVEVDGASHSGLVATERDARREAYLRDHGVRVGRFANDEVRLALDRVVEIIGRVCRGEIHEFRTREGVVAAIPDHPTFDPLRPGRRADQGTSPSGGGSAAMLSALVPNERGLDAALEVNRAAGFPLIGKVSVFTAASEAFARKNTNASIAETLDRFKPVVARVHAAGLLVRGYLSCVIACPFDGPTAPGAVAEWSGRLLELGVDELDLGDTIGAGTPETVRVMLDAVSRVCPIDGSRVPLTLHLHDTFGRAADCVRAALQMGVGSFDGSVAGLGGCPYAATRLADGTMRPAPGNISTELLVETIEDAGFDTGVDHDGLDDAAAFAREVVAAARAAPAVRPEGGAS